MRVSNIFIDADGSPLGYISWYNIFLKKSAIRYIKPTIKNEKYGVQRIEIIAIYFALVDNLKIFTKTKKNRKLRKHIIVIRSDSKSTIEQLNKRIKIKDKIIRRIYESIQRKLESTSLTIIFDYLNRNKNKAGMILENLRKTR